MRSEEPAATGSTRNSTSTRSSVHLRPVAIGELHPAGRCSWCASSTSLVQITWLWTHAPAFVCEDRLACARRREIQRRAA
jgi:hypothetical protein